MLLGEIQDLLQAEVLCGGENLQALDVQAVYASDLMSDVLAQVKGRPVLLTGLCNPQVIRTAEMMDISCVIFVRGKCPDALTRELAGEAGLCVMRTSCTMFEACGLLYQAGMCRGGDVR